MTAADAEGPRFLSADEYLAAGPAQIAWVWEGYLARGAVTLLSAPPKRGKSTLVWGLVEALRAGRTEFLGRALTPGPVVVLSEEGRDVLAATRPIRRLGRGLLLADRSGLYPRRPWAEVVADVRAGALRAGAALVVVDTLRAWVGLPGEAERDADAMTAAVESLLGLAVQADAAVLVTHYVIGEEAVSGPDALTDLVDCALRIPPRPDREAPSSRRTLVAESRWGAATPERLVYAAQDDGALVAVSAQD
jgi:RecA-family ATPase